MSPRAYCALQCAVPAILIILDRRGGSSFRPREVSFSGLVSRGALIAVLFAAAPAPRPEHFL